MPLPKPQEYVENETVDEFIQRCMQNDAMMDEYPDSGQRYAVCLNISAEYAMEKEYDVVDNTNPRYTTTYEQGH